MSQHVESYSKINIASSTVFWTSLDLPVCLVLSGWQLFSCKSH